MQMLFVQYAGLVIAPVAVLFMAYALLMYKKRTSQVSRTVLQAVISVSQHGSVQAMTCAPLGPGLHTVSRLASQHACKSHAGTA